MKRTKQAPSETYAARTARGRVQVTVTMSAEAAARFRSYAAARRWTLGEAVVALLSREHE